MILITGATGTVGGHLVRALDRLQAPTRSLVRSPEKADSLRGFGTHPTVGDYGDPASLDVALQDVDRVFLLATPSEQMARQEIAVLDAVRRTGRDVHVVKLAAAGVDEPEPTVRFLQQHQQVVAALDGLPCTVLAPASYLQNLLAGAAAVQEQGVLPSALQDGAVSHVDARDVADVAAHVLTTDGHEGATYTLTGPVAVTYDEIAAELSTLLDRPVTHARLSPEQLREGLAGLDPWLAEGLVELAAVQASGAAAAVTDEVTKATGRPARSTRDFLADHLSAFR